jgi:hypothetical protein
MATILSSMLREDIRRRSDMLHILANRTYRHLFLAQIIALLGTG